MAGGPLQERLASWWRELEPEKHAALGIFSICGILALGLSFAYLRFHVRAPFLVSRSLLETVKPIASTPTVVASGIDTDRDGLSDAEEMNVYHTSPYVPDTDSDGLSDGQEVALGSDPNCPKGQTCQGIVESLNGATTTQEGPFALDVSAPTAPTSSTVITPPSPETLTPTQMRSYFLTTGLIDQEKLQSLPDAAVEQVYRAAYEEAQRIDAAQQTGVVPTTTP